MSELPKDTSEDPFNVYNFDASVNLYSHSFWERCFKVTCHVCTVSLYNDSI